MWDLRNQRCYQTLQGPGAAAITPSAEGLLAGTDTSGREGPLNVLAYDSSKRLLVTGEGWRGVEGTRSWNIQARMMVGRPRMGRATTTPATS